MNIKVWTEKITKTKITMKMMWYKTVCNEKDQRCHVRNFRCMNKSLENLNLEKGSSERVLWSILILRLRL